MFMLDFQFVPFSFIMTVFFPYSLFLSRVFLHRLPLICRPKSRSGHAWVFPKSGDWNFSRLLHPLWLHTNLINLDPTHFLFPSLRIWILNIFLFGISAVAILFLRSTDLILDFLRPTIRLGLCFLLLPIGPKDLDAICFEGSCLQTKYCNSHLKKNMSFITMMQDTNLDPIRKDYGTHGHHFHATMLESVYFSLTLSLLGLYLFACSYS